MSSAEFGKLHSVTEHEWAIVVEKSKIRAAVGSVVRETGIFTQNWQATVATKRTLDSMSPLECFTHI